MRYTVFTWKKTPSGTGNYPAIMDSMVFAWQDTRSSGYWELPYSNGWHDVRMARYSFGQYGAIGSFADCVGNYPAIMDSMVFAWQDTRSSGYWELPYSNGWHDVRMARYSLGRCTAARILWIIFLPILAKDSLGQCAAAVPSMRYMAYIAHNARLGDAQQQCHRYSTWCSSCKAHLREIRSSSAIDVVHGVRLAKDFFGYWKLPCNNGWHGIDSTHV